MFYFTCNESKIYESFAFWNKLQEFFLLFHDILIYWDAPVYPNCKSKAIFFSDQFISWIHWTSSKLNRPHEMKIGALWLLVHVYELWGNLVYKLTE